MSNRYICGNLVYIGLCTTISLAKALDVNRRNVERMAQSILKNGTDHHFHKNDMRGQCHKMTKNKIQDAQVLIDSGRSLLKTAQELGVSEGCIRYHLRNGGLKKSPDSDLTEPSSQSSTPSYRNAIAISAAEVFGIGASWIGFRALAAKGRLNGAPVYFEHCQSIENAGVLFLLPYLIANGLLSYKSYHQH